VVLDLDGVTVVGGAGEADDGVGIDPRMAGDEAIGFTGLEQGSGQTHGV
jgi:hypothetical protein